jgi:hypothetical protein
LVLILYDDGGAVDVVVVVYVVVDYGDWDWRGDAGDDDAVLLR